MVGTVSEVASLTHLYLTVVWVSVMVQLWDLHFIYVVVIFLLVFWFFSQLANIIRRGRRKDSFRKLSFLHSLFNTDIMLQIFLKVKRDK